jgi:hypothetical protein
MRILFALALAGLALLGSASPGAARVHAQMYCWALDSELPISCEGEDEDDDGGDELRLGSDPSPPTDEIPKPGSARGLTPVFRRGV